MEYTVVREHNLEVLIRKVSDLVKQGWKPLGGIAVVAIAPIAGIFLYYQAMIKE